MAILTHNAPKSGMPDADLPAGGNKLGTLVLFCGLLMALSGFSTDIMLPAFGIMVRELHTSMDLVQGTIPAFSLFFGISQIFYGPMSDRFGRRPAIATGLTIYLAGSLFAALGNDIETVLIGRALQGVGAGTAPVLARAILRDTHSGTALATAMSLTWAIFAIGPIFGPLMGYGVVELFGWRSTFACLAIIAAGLLAYNLLRFSETNQTPNPEALRPRNLWFAVRTITTNRQSTYFLLCGAIAYCGLFTFISNAPRLFANTFGIEGLGFAVLFAATGLGIVVGQYANRALLPRLGILAVLRIAAVIQVLAAGGVALLGWLDLLQAWHFTALMFWFNTSFLVIVSNTAALCLDPHPKLAGIASAFYGCVSNIIGSFFIASTVSFVGISVVHWSVAMLGITLVVALATFAASPKGLTISRG
jgi:DHA1 family bicyclomycin/chloramphenicol resistance-like MFS transporter